MSRQIAEVSQGLALITALGIALSLLIDAGAHDFTPELPPEASEARSLCPLHDLTTLASGFSRALAGIAVDPESGTIYAAAASTGSFLFEVQPDGTIMEPGHQFIGNAEGFYPYVATDIEYYEGNLYTVISGGGLVRYDIADRTASELTRLPNFDLESGLARIGGSLYVTPGSGNGNLNAFILQSEQTREIASILPPMTSTLEHSPAGNLTVASDFEGQLYVLDLGKNEHRQFPRLQRALGAPNFAIGPRGEFVYRINQDHLEKIEIATGDIKLLVEDLDVISGSDCTFGPSTAGDRQISLFITNGARILELDGFQPQADDDEDDIPDEWERQFFPGDLTQLGAEPADFDGDGLSDVQEHRWQANPTLTDSDGDTISDRDEVAAGTKAYERDSDGDGLEDSVETGTGVWVSLADTGTDPVFRDTDADGLLDGVETNTGSRQSAADVGTHPLVADSDGDGFLDGDEMEFQSDPNKASSRPIDPSGVNLLFCADFDSLEEGVSRDLRGQEIAVEGHALTWWVGGRSGRPGDRALRIEEGGAAVVRDAAFLKLMGLLDKATISFWIKSKKGDFMSPFHLMSPPVTEAWQMIFLPNNEFEMYLNGCCEQPAQLLRGSTRAFTADEWQHVAVVKDGARKAVWIGGEKVASSSGSAPLPRDLNQLWIGSNGYRFGHIQGDLDEFSVFGSALGETEIARLVEGEHCTALMGDADSDKDGFSDVAELFAGSDLSDAMDYLRVSSVTRTGAGGLELSWAGVPGRTYHLEYSGNLMPDSWERVASIQAEGATVSWEALPEEAGGGFYRLAVGR